MKFLTMSPISSGSRIAKFGLAVFTLSVSGAIAVAQHEKKASPTPTPKGTVTPQRSATPKPAPTPETKIDAKTEAELLQAEDRFVIAIQNRDANALGEILTDYYADSLGEDEKAVNKRGTLYRATAGTLPVYRVEKERKLIRSGDTFTVEGFAKDISRDGWESRAEEWVQVRRIWLRREDGWRAIAQIITPKSEHESDKELKEEKKE